jgi:hypothetical protein
MSLLKVEVEVIGGRVLQPNIVSAAALNGVQIVFGVYFPKPIIGKIHEGMVSLFNVGSIT